MFCRARAIKKCANVAEKIDLLIDWVRYAFPPHHELEIFDVVMDVHLHLTTLSFEKITEPTQLEVDTFIDSKVRDADHLIPKDFPYDDTNLLKRHETDRIRFVGDVFLLFSDRNLFCILSIALITKGKSSGSTTQIPSGRPRENDPSVHQ